MDYLRILLVDDEPFVMESVASLLEERSGYQLSVHHAVSAPAALRILSQERIDVMICDINMPGVNGLQLSQIAHAQWPLCQIIIFTAYANFEFAQEALRAGVSDYVTKSDGDEVMLTAFHHCVQKMKSELARLDLFRRISPERETLDSPLLENALRSVLGGGISPETRRQLLQSMRYRIDGEDYRLILGRADGGLLTEECCQSLRSAAQSLVRPKCVACHMLRLPQSVAWLIQPCPETSVNCLSSTFELLGQHLHDAEQVVLHFFISPAIRNAADLARQAQALGELARKMDGDANMLVYVLDARRDADDARPKSQIVRQIDQCISDGIASGVTLSSISHDLGYNPSYLSRLYLSETSRRISDVISERRLAAVEQLMRNQALSLQDVAQQVGFETQSYFCRFIRRITRLTPVQMRTQILAGKSFLKQ